MAEAPAPRTWKDRVFSRRALAMAAVGFALGAAAAAVGRRVWLNPQRETARRRFETLKDVTALYGLQVAYRKARGTYANDVDALLALAPDGAAMKARMPDHLDPATLTVVGDSSTFKVEANVLDAERTLVRIKGPIEDKPTVKAPVPVLPVAPGAEPGEGKPLTGR